jgi:acyl CoA:acetate/3-ketoacid CoA transferase alpha subunit
MAEVVELRDAVAGMVSDGDSVALEGFTHLIPSAHEIIRQEKKDLTLIWMTPDLIYDQMIGVGCASKLSFSWGATVEEAKEATGWELRVAEELETTDPPTERELEILRDLKARTEESRKRA